MKCSVCGNEVNQAEFCPMCGAKMDNGPVGLFPHQSNDNIGNDAQKEIIDEINVSYDNLNKNSFDENYIDATTVLTEDNEGNKSILSSQNKFDNQIIPEYIRTEKKKLKKIYVILIIFAVVLVLALGGGGCWYYFSHELKPRTSELRIVTYLGNRIELDKKVRNDVHPEK